MKTKFLTFLLIIGLISAYPVWRYISNAKIFAQSAFGHVSKMGDWTYGSITSNFSGKITIRDVSFTPNNHKQGFDISSVVISTTPMFLLKSNPEKLSYILPETLSLSMNGASLNRKSNDIYRSFQQNSLWKILLGYAGSFGCSKESYTTFEDEIWKNIISQDQIYNADLYFSRQPLGGLDLDLILDAENLFSSTWSSNLKSSYSENEIVPNELLVNKLYYSYLDNGFNLTRNNACIENYNSSFAAYRLSSAEHIQRFLRVNYSKELPSTLINWYQRTLAPDTEFNSIITLDKQTYISDFYRTSQIDLFENSTVEISNSQNEYIPLTLKEIDFTKIDTSLLISENIKKQEISEFNKAKNTAKPETKYKSKTIVTRVGSNNKRMIKVSDLSSVIEKRIRIKTIRGRPINGKLKSINNGMISLDSIFKTGTSTITIPIDKISSVELL